MRTREDESDTAQARQTENAADQPATVQKPAHTPSAIATARRRGRPPKIRASPAPQAPNTHKHSKRRPGEVSSKRRLPLPCALPTHAAARTRDKAKRSHWKHVRRIKPTQCTDAMKKRPGPKTKTSAAERNTIRIHTTAIRMTTHTHDTRMAAADTNHGAEIAIHVATATEPTGGKVKKCVNASARAKGITAAPQHDQRKCSNTPGE